MSKLSELDDSAGGYNWAWQTEAKALQEAAEAAGGAVAADAEGSTAALKLSMDNILMVRPQSAKCVDEPHDLTI